MAEINGEEKRIGVSGEQIEEAVGKVPTIEADVKSNKQSISALQTASEKHAEDIEKNTADIALKANAEEVYTISQTVEAVTETVAEIVANADDDFDTLRELSDWLKNHSGSAAEMNTAIQTNTKAIADNAKAIEANTAEIANNTSDISLLEENKMPWNIGTVTANNNAQKWYKLATFRTTVSNNTYNSAFYIQDRKNNETGILHIVVERITSGGLPSVTLSRIDAHWISAEYQSNPNFKKRNNFVIIGYIEENYLVCELWCRVYEAYGVYYALQLTNTRQSVNVSNTAGWILEKTSTPYDNHPEASDTVRVVKTVDKLAEALEKIDDFETRITALENK